MGQRRTKMAIAISLSFLTLALGFHSAYLWEEYFLSKAFHEHLENRDEEFTVNGVRYKVEYREEEADVKY